MQQKGFHRKLTAILSADVAGYSRLMQDDEAATVATLEAYKQAFSDLIKQHRGRVVDSPGDNLLAEFASVVDAVQCAVAVQKEFHAHNAELPENRRMLFRIGVNLGDVIEEGGRIYGDGVNIAARLEALAEPGGICVSKTAFDHIESKLPLGYEFLGEQTVKNITKPVGAYRVVLEPRVTRKKGTGFSGRGSGRKMAVIGAAAVLLAAACVGLWQVFLKPPSPPPPAVEKADPKKMAFPLPDKPSIAALPFVNLSDDPKQEYFSDGITDEIITALSKLSQLFVIARNSAFTYKGKPTSAKEVSEALGVRYVLEGSVRRDGDRVRIGAQLIDALSGNQLWAERYDRSLKDIFSLQDEITLRVVTELRVRLTSGESARLAAKGAKNLDAYLKVLEAAEQLGRWTKESNQSAKQLLDEAVALDPGYHLAYLLLSITRDADVFFGTTDAPQRSILEGVELAQKAISLDETNGVAYGQLGLLYIRLKQYDKAVELAKKGAPLSPNHFETNRMAAQVLARAGKVEDALPLLDHAMRLNPVPRYTFLIAAGSIYHQAKRYEKALEMYKKATRLDPKNTGGHVGTAATSSLMGNMEEARAAIGELHRVDPSYSLEQVKKIFALRGDRDQEPVNRFIEGLKMAGMPERPPLPLPEKPSIAVLPFANLSGDPQQEYFSDGMADQIITGLSQTPGIHVTARTSSFAYKGKSMTAPQIADQLGVRCLLEGSVQRDADRVRINVQLIDGRSGNHLWAERYDRKFEDIFALQDQITMSVMEALNVRFTAGVSGTNLSTSLKFYRPNSLKAYECYLKGTYHLYRRTQPDVHSSRQLFEEAIHLDPNFGAAYNGLAHARMDEVWFRTTPSPERSIEDAEQAAREVIALTPGQPPPYSLLSQISLLKKDMDGAILNGAKAVESSPNDAGCYFSLGMALVFSGRYDDAIKNLETALRLAPLRPLPYLNLLAAAHMGNKQYDKAIRLWNEALDRNPDYLFAYQGLAAAYELSGNHEKACGAAENVMRVNPKFSVAVEEKLSPIKDENSRKRYFDALRSAGLK